MKLRLKSKQQNGTECAAYRCKKGPNGQYTGVGYLCLDHATKFMAAVKKNDFKVIGAKPQHTPHAEIYWEEEKLEASNEETQALQTKLEAEASELEEALVMIKEFEIEDHEDSSFASEEVTRVSTQWSELEKQRKKITQPLNQSLREINGMFKPAQNSLVQIKGLWTKKIWAYKREQEVKKAALIAEAQAAEAPDAIHEAVIAADATEVELPGQAFRDRWIFEIVDASKIPREYLVPDEVKIGAVVRAMKEDTEIPGVKAWNEGTLGKTRG